MVSNIYSDAAGNKSSIDLEVNFMNIQNEVAPNHDKNGPELMVNDTSNMTSYELKPEDLFKGNVLSLSIECEVAEDC